MKAYLLVMKNSVMSSLSYRAHSIFQIFSSVFSIIILYFLWKSVYSESASGVLRGMTFDDTFLYVAVAAAVSVLLRTWTDYYVSSQILSGDIIMDFFKPYDYIAIRFFYSLGSVFSNLLTITIPSLVVIFFVFHAKVPSALAMLLFVPSLALSYVLNFLFDFFIGTTCFLTKSIWGICTIKEVLILFLSGALVPLPFFPESLQHTLSFFPFKYMYYTPLSLLTIEGEGFSNILTSFTLQAFWAVLMLLVVSAYYAIMIRKLTVNGG